MLRQSRKEFLKTMVAGSAGLAMSSSIFPSKAFAGIAGANERINVAIIGANGRGNYMASKFAQADQVKVTYVCDVDERVIGKVQKRLDKNYGYKPKGEKDFRKMLEDHSVDAVYIATPDHWHTPASILALQAGKHVFVEKPSSHNPREGELFLQAHQKYGKVVQMGNQQRSAPETIEAIAMIHDGVIGRAYFGKAWYANNRKSIGVGKVVKIPHWLDWDLYQGPAPRTDYRDNIVHYNWHWFKRWGTGEILNNGTHEVDICRWALDVNYPVRVTSSGGRYAFRDDWEFYDTQVASFDYPDRKTIVWEGRSCNGFQLYGRGRGSIIFGTEGTAIIDRNGYEFYDRSGKLMKEAKASSKNATLNTRGGGNLDDLHITNFMNAIRVGEKLHSPIEEGNVSVTTCLLGNIAQEVGRTLKTDPQTGKILHDDDAMRYWGRVYEKGWEPVV